MVATDFARSALDLSSPRDGLIFDLQNAADVLASHPGRVSYMAGVAADLIESNVWNADALRALAGTTCPFAWTAELTRSLLTQF